MQIPLTFGGLTHDSSGAPIVLLREEHGPREIRIAVSGNDAARIALFSFSSFEQNLNDLSLRLIEAFQADILQLKILPESEQSVRCELIIQQNDSVVIVESRPGEAIALAVQEDVPIYADPSLFAPAAIEPPTLRESIRLRDVDDFGTVRLA